MSLVLDNLKKLKKNTSGGSVPPNMVNLAPKRRGSGRPNIILILLLVVSVVCAGVIFFLDSGSTSYKVTQPSKKPTPAAPVKSAQAEKPAPAKPQPTSNAASSVTEAQIQAKIDDAVKKALNKAEQNFAEQIISAREANVQRAGNVDKLPEPFDSKKRVVTQQAKELEKTSPESISDNLQNNMNNIRANRYGAEPVAEKQSDSAKSEEPKKMRQPISAEQKAIFDKKIAYNTLTTTGERAFKSGDYDRAADSYEKALKIKKSEAALSNLIKAKIAKGDIQSVNPLLLKHKVLANEKIVSTAALDLENAGFGDKGLALIAQYIGVFETDGRLYYVAGQINERAGRYVRAEAAYMRAVEHFPTDAYYLFAYARMLDVNKKLPEAVIVYKKVSTLDTSDELKTTSAERAFMIEDFLQKIKEPAGVIMNGAESSVSE
ncbi:MAG: hypothetical protein C0602_00730 [Denitrovibrio sp.]|nr:MAG: hypothetical protein C0602_00730 [Denitrovibrio sp.]